MAEAAARRGQIRPPDDVVYDAGFIVVNEIIGEGRDSENNAGGYFCFDKSLDTQPSEVFLLVSKACPRRLKS